MPTNFMFADLGGSLAAFCIWTLFALAPGYAAGWWLNLMEFRRQTPLVRITLSVPLSLALFPVLAYLAARYGSMTAVWILYGTCWISFAAVAVRKGERWYGWDLSGLPRGLAAAAAAWLGIALFSLVDLQIGKRLYYSAIAFDYAVRAGFTHSIATGGIPAQNPFFFPGHPVPLRYHYFWLILCSLVERMGGGWVSARQAIFGGIAWCGLAVQGLVVLYLKFFWAKDGGDTTRRATVGVLLLAITGLDLLPTLLMVAGYSLGLLGEVLPSVELWNEQVDGFVNAVLWEPHHVCALIAGLTAFLLLWKGPQAEGRRAQGAHAAAAGAAVATAAGASVYVAMVFAAFLVLWTGVTVWRRWHRDTAALAIAGLAATMLALPYVLDLRGPAAGGKFLQLTVRTFLIPDWILKGQGLGQGWRLALFNALLLPLNYFLELGFFAAAAHLWWRQRRTRRRALERHELAAVLLAGTSVTICTFLRSGVIDNNDLGWRGFLPAQFMLLVCAVDLVPRLRRGAEAGDAGRGARRLLATLLAIGAAGTVYDLAILRFHPVMADGGLIPPVLWMARDRAIGKRTFATREAYEWLQGQTPSTATIQFNPAVTWQNTPAMLYSERQIVAADRKCYAIFGGDPHLCEAIQANLDGLFARAADEGRFERACESLPADVLVAADTDPAWHERRSWVWTQHALYGNAYVRFFACRGRRPANYQMRSGTSPGEKPMPMVAR